VRAALFSSECDIKMATSSSRSDALFGGDGGRDETKDFCRRELATKNLSDKEKCAPKA